jgi:hypothetical protein
MGQLHAATLSLIPEHNQMEQGRSLTVNMLYIGPASPDELNVKRWQTEVFIERRDREERRLHDGSVEVKQRLTLYPKSTGLLTLGPLALGGAKSDRFDLLVTPAVVNDVDITPIWRPLPDQMWQGESIERCLTIPLSEQRNRVKIDLPEIPGISVVQTQNKTYSFEDKPIAERCWRFMPQQPGNYLVELPPIIQRGRGRWTFYLPSQTVEVLPLPSYLPTSISVGKPQVQVNQGEQGWTVNIQAPSGQPAETLWGLKSALANAMSIDADQIESVEGQLFVPYKGWSFGQSGTARVPYFNTDTERLDVAELELKAPWRLPMFATVLLSIVGVAMLVKATRLAIGLNRRRERVQAFKQAISSATTADEIKTTLLSRSMSGAENNAQYKTLQQWADSQGDEEAASLAKSLNQLAYGQRAEAPLDELKRALINRLR